MVDSTDRLSKADRALLERKVDINVQRDVTTMSKQVPDDPTFKEEVTAKDRTQALIDDYNDFIAEVDKILDALAIRCRPLVYKIEPEKEYDCAAAIEALFEGEKNEISYEDYVKILELEAAVSRELIAEGGRLDGLGIS
jgi:hypothetical protein